MIEGIIQTLLRTREYFRPEVLTQAPPLEVSNILTAASTFEAYATRWLQEKEAAGLLSGIDYRSTLKNHLLPYLGRSPLAEITPRTIRELVQALRTKPKLRGSGSLSNRTVRNVYGIAHDIFATAVADEVIDRNPCCLRRGDLPRNTPAKENFRKEALFSAEELRQIISLDIEPYWRTLFTFCVFTGCRIGEALGLKWKRISFALEPMGKIEIARSFSSKRGKVGKTKTGAIREVPLHPQLLPVLREWRDGGYAAYRGVEPEGTLVVFPREDGKPRRNTVVLHRLHSELDKLELRHRRVHDFRRSFITLTEAVPGIDREALRRFTHAASTSDIHSTYREVPWSYACGEFGKWTL